MIMIGIVAGCLAAFVECFVVAKFSCLRNIYQNGFNSIWFSRAEGFHKKHIRGSEVSITVSIIMAAFTGSRAGGVAMVIATATAILVSEPMWFIIRGITKAERKEQREQFKANAKEVNQHLIRPVGKGIGLIGKVGWAGVKGLVSVSKKTSEMYQTRQSRMKDAA